MRIALIVCLLSFCGMASAFAQTVTIKASVESRSEQEVVLRLDSGRTIVVPLADVVSGPDSNPTSAPAAAAPQAADNSAYRTARCRELARSSTLIPQATRERELRELECDKLAAALAVAPLDGSISAVDVRQVCATEWPSNFQMRAFCEKQQQEALTALRARSMTTSDRQTIRKQCAGQWPQNYMMLNFCEEQQIKALIELGRER